MTKPTQPSTMKAWQFSSTRGGLEENLHINSSAPLPKPNGDQHLVRVFAAALNPVDYKPTELAGVTRFLLTEPAIPGCDFAGSIVTSASGSPLKAGQLVFGGAGSGLPVAAGALAEFALAKVTAVVPVPAGVDLIDAAGAGVCGVTAYQSVVAHVKKGDRVFINSGSGGTSVFGIQLAKAAGCHVTTTYSTPNIELCTRLGADEVLDYKKQNIFETLKASGTKFDHAVDNVSADNNLIWGCHHFMKPKALFVTVGGDPSLAHVAEVLKRRLKPGFLSRLDGNMQGFFPNPNQKGLNVIAGCMAAGKVKAVIDEQFAFEDAVQAYKKLRKGRAKGKIVVKVASEEFKRELGMKMT